MSQTLWTTVDHYLNAQLVGDDPVLEAALTASAEAGLPSIAVAPNQGKMLHLLAQAIGARRILEVGTRGGYSTVWLARANLDRAGLAAVAQVRIGPGLDSLPKLADEAPAPFDLVFIDADKPSNADYFAWALKLIRPGGVIIVDNVVRKGTVADPASQDANVLGVRRLLDLIAAEPRVSATAVQTVGEKGHDGFIMAVVAN